MRPESTAARARPSVQFVASDNAIGFVRLAQFIWPGSIGTTNDAATTAAAGAVGAGGVAQAASPAQVNTISP